MKMQQILTGLLGCMALFVVDGAWANTAGHIEFVHGTVQVTTTSGQTHALQKGDAINEGDVINSAKGASAQILMEDGGFIAVRQETRMKIDSFKFSKKSNEPEHSFFSLFKGGFRAITGLIGRIRHQDYKITTPAATIGIRGTDHETFFTPIALPGIPSGVYSKVNLGETSITTDRGTINVLPNQMGFAGGLNQIPQLQPINTNIFTVVPAPAPEAGQQENDQGNDNNQSGEQGQQTAQGGTQEGGDQGSSDTDNGEPIRDTAVVDNTSQDGGTTSTAPTSTDTSTTTTTTVSQPTTTIPVTATSNTLTLNMTTQTVSSGTTSTPITSGTIVTTAPYVNNDISYAFAASFTSQMSSGAPGNVSPLVNPTAMTASYNCNSCSIVSWSLNSLVGGTPASNADATTQINWGYWNGLTSATFTVTGSGYTGSTGPISNPGPLAWINAPAASFYVPVAQTGTATYSSIGGVATDGATTYITTASLGVDFANQLVTSLNLTIAGGAGTLATITGANAPLGGGAGNAGFYFCTSGASCTDGQNGTLTATNATSGTYDGTVEGALTGASLTGAILSFDLYGSTGAFPGAPPYQISGVTALGLSTGSISPTASYQVALSSMDLIPVVPYPGAGYSYPVTQDMVGGNVFSSSTLVLDANGNPTQWQDNSNNGAATNLGLVGATKVTITGASAFDHGTDSTSGISWGRWSGGTLNYVSLVNSGTATVNNTGALHWLTLPATSGPMNLPTSGTFNYTLVGNTLPTDQTGATGVLNSASLTANFSAMTVDVGTNVTVSGTTFNGTATGVPIQQGTYFEVGNGGGGQLGTLTCSGTCGAVNSGHVVGAFTQSGIGAGVSYGFETGPSIGSPTKVISGVAAFHR